MQEKVAGGLPSRQAVVFMLHRTRRALQCCHGCSRTETSYRHHRGLGRSRGIFQIPWYALRENYAGVVAKAGGMPLILPNESALVDDYAALINGLVITGGAFDVPPALYGEGTSHDTVILKENRTAFELGITRKALERTSRSWASAAASNF